MVRVQEPVVSGVFYPSDPKELRKLLDTFFRKVPHIKRPLPRALIVPHAGYTYSGEVAAYAYADLDKYQKQIKRVVIMAPTHHVSFMGMVFPEADFFVTPLGTVKVDRKALNKIASMFGVAAAEIFTTSEHSLEVQLPFLQSKLQNDFLLVPFLVGVAHAYEVAIVLQKICDDETLIVISSDLSHYHDYATAKKIDAETAKHILDLDYSKISMEDACGYMPLCGFLEFAALNKWHAKLLTLKNSGDTSGDKSKVVGYGAFHFYDKNVVA